MGYIRASAHHTYFVYFFNILPFTMFYRTANSTEYHIPTVQENMSEKEDESLRSPRWHHCRATPAGSEEEKRQYLVHEPDTQGLWNVRFLLQLRGFVESSGILQILHAIFLWGRHFETSLSNEVMFSYIKNIFMWICYQVICKRSSTCIFIINHRSNRMIHDWKQLRRGPY